MFSQRHNSQATPLLPSLAAVDGSKKKPASPAIERVGRAAGGQ
jgi:hypothetical protein